MANAPLSSSPRSRINRAAASRAVDSLLKWIRAQRNPKNVHETIFLILTLTKTPHKLQSKPYRIPLPHPLHDPSTVSQILSLSDLRTAVSPAGELPFTDRRIARLLNRFEKRENGRKSNVCPEQVRQVCFSTVLNLGSGTCCGIRVGRASQGKDEIVDNLMAAVDGAVLNVPRKWSNVMAFHVKTSESLALPIYEKANWCHKDDDEVMEDEKLGKVERRPEGGSRKRGSDESELDGGEVRRSKR